MKLAELSKPQWDAAHEAARIMMSCNPNRERDRLKYRLAKFRLAAMLPGDADVRELISQAAQWSMLNDIAATIAGIAA